MKKPPFSRRTAWDLSENPLARELARARASGRALADLTESNPTRAGFGGERLVALLGHPRGAAYAPDTGDCAGGPCRGGLVKVAMSERDGVVHWHTSHLLQPIEF